MIIKAEGVYQCTDRKEQIIDSEKKEIALELLKPNNSL